MNYSVSQIIDRNKKIKMITDFLLTKKVPLPLYKRGKIHTIKTKESVIEKEQIGKRSFVAERKWEGTLWKGQNGQTSEGGYHEEYRRR